MAPLTAKKSRRDFGDGNLCIEGIRRSLLVRSNHDMNGRHFGSKATQPAFSMSIIFFRFQETCLRCAIRSSLCAGPRLTG